MERRWTLLMPSGPGGKKHLYFVLNNASGTGNLALAPLCSMIPEADRACLLSPGDHPFVRHESFISYRECYESRSIHLESMLATGYVQRREDASEELFQRVLNGARTSRLTPRWARELIGGDYH